MSLKKIFIVAHSEYLTAVRSRAFLVSVILMPVLMTGSIALQTVVASRADTEPRRLVVIDQTDRIYPAIEQATTAFNQRGGPQFIVSREQVAADGLDTARLALSERVRTEEIFAFVEIPPTVFDPANAAKLLYHSDHPSYITLPSWIERIVNREIQGARFKDANVDPALVARLSQTVDVDNLGLLEADGAGGLTGGEAVDPIKSTAIPAAMMFLVYIVVMSSAPQLLNAVMEEKMSRISEVLLGSVLPTDLMLGKLLGSAGVSLTLATLYLGGASVVAQRYGYAGALTPGLIALFLLFLVLAVLIFGSIFTAIGAACNDMKDAQGMMGPAMLLVMFPMLSWMVVLRAPDSTVSTVLSLIPFATPFLMLLRVSLQPGPPAWQLALSIVLTLSTMLFLVWAAGRIFRTGILMQGKSASFAEMIRWVKS